ncbi:MAG: serine--tRNA ligase [Nanoarchaeota archaeon]|nr:serine--tRNA ligase [Nanoarchaeota archaeon]
MIDIKLIRENPELVKANIKKKFQEDKLYLVDEIRKKDIDWRNQKQRIDKLRHDRNSISQEISKAKKEGKNPAALMKTAKLIPAKIEEIEKKADKIMEAINEKLMKIPNILHKSVPIGKDSSQNVEIKKIGTPKKFDFPLKNHVELAEALDIADFDTSAKTSGNGFYYLKGDLALLNQALVSFAREFMISKGYEYIEPPLMIRENILTGVYSTEEINAMSYKISDEDLYLIATSEHPLIGMFINKTLRKEDLPKKITGYSMCFRKEIGSHGINEKGLFRTHQFNKQEMVVICRPEDSYKLYDEMLEICIEVYKQLGIPTRVLESCSGDLADLKAKGADLEYWSPLEQSYKEIGSITNMEEAQARRLNIKFIDEKNERKFAHTLNNTVIATSRALVAILENNQQKDGSIKIPEVLQKYISGKKVIEKN